MGDVATLLPSNSRLRLTLTPATSHSGVMHPISVGEIHYAAVFAHPVSVPSLMLLPKTQANSPSMILLMLPPPTKTTPVPPKMDPDMAYRY